MPPSGGAGGAPLVLIAAGGTGGHLFPAEALAGALAKHGVTVDLATDVRATRYGGKFPARAIHVIPSETLRGRGPLSYARTAGTIGVGVVRALRLMARIKPLAVVGFGGYPTIPPVLAASLRGIPTLIHEQNGVMGRANRLLAPRATAIATGFPGLAPRDPKLAAKITLTGNPVRPAVVAAAAVPYAAPQPGDPLRLLIFGGSQGARIMADVVPAAIERLEPALWTRLAIVQQTRDEDLPRVKAAYDRLKVAVEVAPFFADLPARIAASHLIVARSGASTVAELAAIGRPAILVPLPHALDQDQLANARVLEQARGAIRIDQAVLTPDRLAAEISALAAEPSRLTTMAASARSAGTLDAADRLAALVLAMAGRVQKELESP
jgi:UDP-N-acetylglucosamine--N-acetylmuramyl-(pentapeptide) pyrophosphoryl-undecaprenol N-acetylglucosamine transferase